MHILSFVVIVVYFSNVKVKLKVYILVSVLEECGLPTSIWLVYNQCLTKIVSMLA